MLWINYALDQLCSGSQSDPRLWSNIPRKFALVANAFDVFAGARVDLNHITFFDKSWHDKLAAGLYLGWLSDVSGRVTLGARFALDHFQFDVVWWSHSDWQTVEKQHAADHAIFEILPRIIHFFIWQFVLFERRIVHEDESVSLAIQILHIDFFNVRRLELITPLIGPFELGIANQVAKLALVHRISLTWFDEVHFGHQVGFAIDLYF
jgi:hypothetical protein